MRAVTNSSDIMHVLRSEMSEYKIVSVYVYIYFYYYYYLFFLERESTEVSGLSYCLSVWIRG